MTMKKRLPWQLGLLVPLPYAALVLNLSLLRAGLAAWLCSWLGTTLLVSALTMRHAFRQQDARQSIFWCMLVKLLHIPAYGISLLVVIVLFAAPPVWLALLAANWLVMMSTSAYGLRGIWLHWQRGRVSKTAALALAVSQLVFVLDAAGSILLFVLDKLAVCSPDERSESYGPV